MNILARIPSISRRALCVCLIAAAPAPVAKIQAQLTAFVGDVGTATLDPRIARDCDTQPVIEWYGSLKRAVVVACPGSPGWRVFVPVRGAATANGGTAPMSFANLSPIVVKRGDAVQIHAGGEGFRVTASGSAEQDGRVGAHIRIRNGQGTVTNAIVESAGNVSLPGYNSGDGGR